MRIVILSSSILVAWASLVSAAEEAAPRDENLKPGLAYVFFDDGGFQRPGSHGVEAGIKSHGLPTAVQSHGIDPQVDLSMEGITGYSRLWTGYLRFPASGEVTLRADVDNGMRLYLDRQCVLDAWSPNRPREATIRVDAGQLLPLRIEYLQSQGPSYLQLGWHWEGHPHELIPPVAFWHTEKQLLLARAIANGTVPAGSAGEPSVVAVPTGSEEFASAIYQKAVKERKPRTGPIRLRPGPHLFIDDFLVEKSQDIKRRVNCPRRDPDLPNPVVTGKQDHCVAPYMTVLRDPRTSRFRIWYNVYKEKEKDGSARFAYMESEDGVNWIRPHRVLADPGQINFGCSVIDDGPGFPNPDQRYKLAWWANGGMNIATSCDGLEWSMLRPYPVFRHNHDINNIFRDPIRNRYMATASVHTEGPTWSGTRRTTMQTASPDLLSWEEPWYVITADDSVEKGQTQFYGMHGYLARGDLIVGLVKILHDDWQAPDTPEGAFGVGYTTLAWTRDGRHWTRDLEPFFEPDPHPAAWDHAHAWLDFQLPVGDEVYIYYGGYKFGHKMDRWEGRQIGLVKMVRDRYVSREAGSRGGSLKTPPVVLEGKSMTVNALVKEELRIRLLDTAGRPLPGFDADDCQPIRGDLTTHPVRWRASLASLADQPVQLEFLLRDAQLYGFELLP